MLKKKVLVFSLVVGLLFGVTLTTGALVIDKAENFSCSETLVYGGGLWQPPSNWNPLNPGSPVPGTVGLVYENLFHYHPMKGEFQPWLAKSGAWVKDNVYKIRLRDGIKWTDGEMFTAEDVKFTFELGKKNKGLSFSPIWKQLEEVNVVSDTELNFVFTKGKVPYQEWKLVRYETPIVPQHIWEDIPGDKLLSKANKNPIGTGPYVAHRAAEDRMIWARNNDWWGNDVFGQPTPKALENVIVYQNNTSLGMTLQGAMDLNNYFLPGVPRLVKSYPLKTYYDREPYMIPDNVALLFLNTKRKGLDDPTFRRALAFATNPEVIAERVYDNQVKAADSTGMGLTPAWKKYRSEEAVEKYGFSYNPEKAKQMLAEAGYKDVDNDGWREHPDGSDLDFIIIVPGGWTDWMSSIDIISQQLQKVGVNAKTQYPDYTVYENKMHNANFDMLINNFNSNQSATPYTYWEWVVSDQIYGEQAQNGNYGRYENEKLFDLVTEFSFQQSNSPAAKRIAADIQEIMLKDMPSIPMWYNGMWALSNTQRWTNWPTAESPTGLANTWNRTFTMGTIEMLIHLKPANN